MERYLKMIDVKERIRDPLYGFILLTKEEKQLIDTPLFQRLRRIHQLALTKYVYPSAEHSRFVHSLGVMHCATMILAGVFDHKHTQLGWEPNNSLIKTLRFAALLHDIGHLPFSHSIEKHWLSGLKHESLSQYIIENDETIASIIHDSGVQAKDVASLLTKRPPARLRLFLEIISGQLDADRADYLLRDSHCCGAKYGEYDLARFLNIFAATEDAETGMLTLCVDESDLHVAESLLIARYHYNMQIPFHRTRMGYDLILKRFMRDFDEYKEPFSVSGNTITSVDLERLSFLDDYEIIERIKQESKKGNSWAPYLLRSKHLVPIIDTSSESPPGADKYKAFVRALESDSRFVQDEDYFLKEQSVEVLKWIRPMVDAGTGHAESTPQAQDMILLLSKEGRDRTPQHVDICERSWIFGHLAHKPPTIYRVYVTPEKKQEAQTLLARV